MVTRNVEQPIKPLIGMTAGSFRGKAPVAAGTFADASRFDGANDYLTRGAGLTGLADGSEFGIAFAVKFNGSDGTTQTFLRSNQGKTIIYRQPSNFFRATLADTANVNVCDLIATTEIVADGEYHHIYVGVNNDAGTLRAYIAIDGVIEDDDVLVNSTALDLTAGDWGFMARHLGNDPVDGDVSMYYLDDHYEANVTKFYNGGIVDLGDDASSVDGSAPIVYMRDGQTQAGTGGAISATGSPSIVTGPLVV